MQPQCKVTVVSAVAVLLAWFGSGDKLFTLAVFVIVPTFFGVTTMVTVALAPLPKVPKSQVMVPFAAVQLPAEDAAETKETLAGRLSVNVTSSACPGRCS